MDISKDLHYVICALEDTDPYETAVNGSVIDTRGYDGVLLIAQAEAGADATYKFKAQQGAVADGSDMADLTGTLLELDATVYDPSFAVIDVNRPTERYVRGVLFGEDENVVTAPAVSILAVLYGPREAPVSGDNVVRVSAAAEGTP